MLAAGIAVCRWCCPSSPTAWSASWSRSDVFKALARRADGGAARERCWAAVQRRESACMPASTTLK